MGTQLIRADDALNDRVRVLRSILPTLATDVAVARREAARLRRENEVLKARIEQLGNHAVTGVAIPLTPAPNEALRVGGTAR